MAPNQDRLESLATAGGRALKLTFSKWKVPKFWKTLRLCSWVQGQVVWGESFSQCYRETALHTGPSLRWPPHKVYFDSFRDFFLTKTIQPSLSLCSTYFCFPERRQETTVLFETCWVCSDSVSRWEEMGSYCSLICSRHTWSSFVSCRPQVQHWPVETSLQRI